MFKIGFFIFVKKGDVIVRKWSPELDEFCKLDETSEKCFIEGVKNYSFDTCLGPYNLERLKIWQEISS